MQAHIVSNKHAAKSLRYNEEKVAMGRAERISAENFLKDHDRLTKTEIIERFRQRTSLNEQYHDHCFHISVNFGVTENLSNEKMIVLASRYMTVMGFEDQPYVVYRHYDAGHEHLHILATAVKADGALIHLTPRNYHESQVWCQSLEKEFSLEKNERTRPEQKAQFVTDHAQKVVYGEVGLTRAVSNVVNTVMDHYKYTSLEEYNAILRQYNVMANRGQESSRLNRMGGLFYHALDSDGRPIGVPLKASKFFIKPTLKNLEQKFIQNQAVSEDSRKRLSTAIDWALAGRAPNWERFTENLEKEGIATVIDKSDGGERIFFVDHIGKIGCEGKRLGDDYTLDALRNRCALEEQIDEQVLKPNLNIRI